MNEKIGLFFGTFNPVHRGHEALATSFLKSQFIDDLWIILTPEPPHKEKKNIAPFSDRWKMLNLLFSSWKNVTLMDIELKMKAPNHTIHTLFFLKEHYPDKDFLLCIGGDTLQTFPSWYQYQRYSDVTTLLVAERPGASRDIPDVLNDFHIQFCPHQVTKVSSSKIRKDLSEGKVPVTSELPPQIIQYIQNKKLYQ